MSLPIRALPIVIFALSAVVLGQTQTVNPDAKILADFQERVDAYMKLVEKADDGAPPLKETKDPAEIAKAQDVLADHIRTARAGAKPGDIFTPEIQKKFKALLRPELKGKEGAETKETIAEESPAPGAMPLKVNTRYPEKQPLSTVPPNVLSSLPKLPDELEYRFVGKHLILRDIRANIIVDFIANAIP